ncbi:unnamed protein product (macronuclear) [Paramecium tetraurelia]|uniref:TRAF3-interacting protein 1 N-terminal domain-containing protein n=1 Tax=Paramecium tetraurelia TaxID=5888 RepID=A0BWC0_PARTE|nr:uncharacterized protein GSPATT00032689001 [Paramecium tetraurelia]CAK62837.1 unnamed protein product [Paramecium tetraurelia]|eukprot:XP_001430235.1 hypothetical protein (macronuclear) [Paramecium tetraurelia strain d4-2]
MADFWQTTADMFSTLITKPMMKEQYLIKPPFNYIFDIILETYKKTGYAKGLYKIEEWDDNYYYIKERRIFFLQKIIDLTSQLQMKNYKPNLTIYWKAWNPNKQIYYCKQFTEQPLVVNVGKFQYFQILAGIASCSAVQKKEKVKGKKQLIEQQNIDSLQQTQTKLNSIVDQQLAQIQELEDQLEKNADPSFDQKQYSEQLFKKQLEQLKNSETNKCGVF